MHYYAKFKKINKDKMVANSQQFSEVEFEFEMLFQVKIDKSNSRKAIMLWLNKVDSFLDTSIQETSK